MNTEIAKNLNIVLDFLTASDKIENIPVCDAVFLFGSSKTGQIPKSGAHLFKKGLAKKIVCTGKHSLGKVSGPAGFATEAEWYQDILLKEGVPREVIILEVDSTNTLENVLFGMSACYKQGFYPKKLILCPIPFLCRRSSATFRRQFPEIQVFNYTSNLLIEDYLIPERIKRLLGEFDRFKEYTAKGDITRIEVPQKVAEAVSFLNSLVIA